VNVARCRGTGHRPRWRISQLDLEQFLAGRAATPRPTSVRRRKAKRNENVIEFF
jgi:hypothetical protein